MNKYHIHHKSKQEQQVEAFLKKQESIQFINKVKQSGILKYPNVPAVTVPLH